MALRRIPCLLGALMTSLVLALSGATAYAADEPSPDAEDPLQVTIDGLAPAVIPAKGPIRITGTITNTTDETWTDLNVHPLRPLNAITTSAQLRTAIESDKDAPIGERITEIGSFDTLDEIAPNETATYAIKVNRDLVVNGSTPGVYWFGVQVLGTTAEGRDGLADGRARTLLAQMPRKSSRVDLALVLPIRGEVKYTGDGQLTSLGRWQRELSDGGRLHDQLQLGKAAGESPVTWLVDPAVLDAIQHLAQGNAATDLTPPEQGGTDESSTELDELAEIADTWLSDFTATAADDTVLHLPYGDLDVSAAARHQPALVRSSTRTAASVMERLGIDSSLSVAPPSGTMAPDAVPEVPDEATILLSRTALGEREVASPLPNTIRAQGRAFSMREGTAETGGDKLTPLTSRQQILAEASVRSLTTDGPSQLTTMVLPPDLASPTVDFVQPLTAAPWLNLTGFTAGAADPGTQKNFPEYPQSERKDELLPSTLTAAHDVAKPGAVLDEIVTGDTTAGKDAARRALTNASVNDRGRDQQAALQASRAVRTFVQGLLDEVDLEVPSSITLSSDKGPFNATLRNDLPRKVKVRVDARGSAGLKVTAPSEFRLPAKSSTPVRVEAEATRTGVRTITLQLTDSDGNPLSPPDIVPVRSSQISGAIWAVMGLGAVLAVGAFSYQRIRGRTRRG